MTVGGRIHVVLARDGRKRADRFRVQVGRQAVNQLALCGCKLHDIEGRPALKAADDRVHAVERKEHETETGHRGDRVRRSACHTGRDCRRLKSGRSVTGHDIDRIFAENDQTRVVRENCRNPARGLAAETKVTVGGKLFDTTRSRVIQRTRVFDTAVEPQHAGPKRRETRPRRRQPDGRYGRRRHDELACKRCVEEDVVDVVVHAADFEKPVVALVHVIVGIVAGTVQDAPDGTRWTGRYAQDDSRPKALRGRRHCPRQRRHRRQGRLGPRVSQERDRPVEERLLIVVRLALREAHTPHAGGLARYARREGTPQRRTTARRRLLRLGTGVHRFIPTGFDGRRRAAEAERPNRCRVRRGELDGIAEWPRANDDRTVDAVRDNRPVADVGIPRAGLGHGRDMSARLNRSKVRGSGDVVQELKIAVALEDDHLSGALRQVLRHVKRVNRAGRTERRPTGRGVRVEPLIADPTRPTARDGVNSPVFKNARVLRVAG